MGECVFCHGHGFFGHTNADGEWDEIICTNCNAYYDQILSTRKTVTPPADDPLAAALARITELEAEIEAAHTQKDELIAFHFAEERKAREQHAATVMFYSNTLHDDIAEIAQIVGMPGEFTLDYGTVQLNAHIAGIVKALEAERAAHEETRKLAAEALKPLVDLFTEWDTECDTMAYMKPQDWINETMSKAEQQVKLFAPAAAAYATLTGKQSEETK